MAKTQDGEWAESGTATNANPTNKELAATAEGKAATNKTDWSADDTAARQEQSREDARQEGGRHIRTQWPYRSLKIDDREITDQWTHVKDEDIELVRQTAADHEVPLEEKGVDEDEANPHTPPIA